MPKRGNQQSFSIQVFLYSSEVGFKVGSRITMTISNSLQSHSFIPPIFEANMVFKEAELFQVFEVVAAFLAHCMANW